MAKGDKRGTKRKRTKDPNAPKRALSAFFWFCNDERPKVKEILPDSTVGEIAKELGRRWHDATEDQKSKFEALSAKDKARYEKEMNVYKSKKGRGAAPPAKGGGASNKAKGDSDEDSEEVEEEEDSD